MLNILSGLVATKSTAISFASFRALAYPMSEMIRQVGTLCQLVPEAFLFEEIIVGALRRVARLKGEFDSMKKNTLKNINLVRRDFIKSAAAVTVSALIPASISIAIDPIIRNPVRSSSTRDRNDITFCLTTDTHYNARWQDTDNEAGNKRVVDRLNNMAGKIEYPSQFGGGGVQHPRGVVCLGDLTDNAKD